jgi:hypothetical protein
MLQLSQHQLSACLAQNDSFPVDGIAGEPVGFSACFSPSITIAGVEVFRSRNWHATSRRNSVDYAYNRCTQKQSATARPLTDPWAMRRLDHRRLNFSLRASSPHR